MLNGSEHFCINDSAMSNLTVADYWKWAYSNLFDNTTRSALAEFIVASALGVANTSVRNSRLMHTTYNLLSKEGYRISIVSASYTQSLDAEYPDYISFQNILNSSCDVCIFCVHKSVSENDSPLNLDSWEFYVILSNQLTKRKSEQRTITLPSLIALTPLWCDYYGIEEAIKETMNA